MTRSHNAPSNQSLIESIAADLTPVRAFDFRHGVILTTLAALVTVLAVAVFDGFWHGIIDGEANAFFFIVNGMLLVLAAATATATIRIASPAVGNRYDGPRWGLAMLGVLPAVALATLIAQGDAHSVVSDPYGINCMLSGLAAALLTAAALVAWLRRGAPVQIERAGMLAGVTAGAVGSLAYGLSCPIDSFGHLAVWHIAPVAIAALLGRLAFPSLLRW